MFARNFFAEQRFLTTLLTGILGGSLFAMAASGASPKMAAGMVLGMLVAGAVVFQPRLGLYLTALVIPMERFGRFTDDSAGITLSVMRAIGILTLGAFLLHAAINRWRLRSDAAFNLYLVYWLFTLVALFFTNDLRGNLQGTTSFLADLLFLFLILNMVRNYQDARTLIILWLAATVVLGCYTMYDWHLGNDYAVSTIGSTANRFTTVLLDTSESGAIGAVKRAVGSTSNPAVYGINLILTLPFFAYLARTTTRIDVKLLVAVGSGIVLYNIFLTNTRAVLLMTVVLAAMMAWKRLLRFSLPTTATIVVSIVVMLPLLPSAIYDRILDPSNYSLTKSATLQMRFEYWRAALKVITENWLTGTGVGNTHAIGDYVSSAYQAAYTVHTAHNEFLTSFVEVGLFGWLVLMAFLTLILRYAVTTARLMHSRPGAQAREQYWFMIACQLALVATLIYGLQVDVLHFPLKAFWLVAGLSCVMHRLAPTLPSSADSAPAHQ